MSSSISGPSTANFNIYNGGFTITFSSSFTGTVSLTDNEGGRLTPSFFDNQHNSINISIPVTQPAIATLPFLYKPVGSWSTPKKTIVAVLTWSTGVVETLTIEITVGRGSVQSIKSLPFHGEIFSANASGGVDLNIYLNNGVVAYQLASNEYFVVTNVMMSSTGAGRVTLFCDSNSDLAINPGETIAEFIAPTGGGSISIPLTTPYVGVMGAPLAFIAPSGNATCQANGFIRANPNDIGYEIVQAAQNEFD